MLLLEGRTAHVHGPGGEHVHEGLAADVWLDPLLAIEQARAIAQAFTRARPHAENTFRAALAALEQDLLALDRRLQEVAEAIGDSPLLFSHPIYQYLQHRYGLNGRSVHWEPDEAPSERMWRELEELLRAHPARWMVWEAEPRDEIRRRLEAYGVRSLVYTPCVNQPKEGDLLSAMKNNAEQLSAAGSS